MKNCPLCNSPDSAQTDPDFGRTCPVTAMYVVASRFLKWPEIG